MKRRLLTVVGVSLAFGIGAPQGASPAAAPDLPTQTIAGGGTGISSTGVQYLAATGSYASTSQIGIGRYQIGFAHGSPTGVQFTRSDGMMLRGEYGDIARSTECGAAAVEPFVDCITVDLVGTADISLAHLVLALVDRSGGSASTFPSSFLMRGTLTLRRRLEGYVVVDRSGTTFAYGGVDHLGDAHTTKATDLELTPSRAGYWIVNAVGQVFAFGDADSFGNAAPSALAPGELVTSMSATPSARGYWLFTSKGRAIPFGDARFHGDLHSTTLNGGIVGAVATPTGEGYYMVGSDGGVFAFGDARFHGSTGNMHLNRPVVGLVPIADNTGYWLVASDGGVFSFNAPFHGSMGGIALNRPIVTMVPYDNSYLMVASDGGVFNFSNGLFFGSRGGVDLPAPIVGGGAGG